ncbi:unnamed protein product, partial [Rotaria sordida]
LAFDEQKETKRWLDEFTTFNILFRHTSNIDDQTLGHNLLVYGLKLLRSFNIIRHILKSIFSLKGIQFILTNIDRLEQSFLLLALKNYSNLKESLRRLGVDLNQIQTKNKLLTQSNQSFREISLTADLQDNETPVRDSMTTTIQRNNRMSQDDWRNAMKHIRRLNPDKSIQNESNNPTFIRENMENLVQKLSGNVLSQDSTNLNISLINNIDFRKMKMDSIEENIQEPISIRIDQVTLKAHVRDHPNLIRLYEQAGTISSINSSMDNSTVKQRGDLQISNDYKPTEWTYDMLIKSEAIGQLIAEFLNLFQQNWEEFLKKDCEIQHGDIQWCIIIDNSGSMSIHRNVIHEILVILMEVLRKMEFKFAVTCFGGQKNQLILKNMDQLFTYDDGQFVLEAITLDEGTFPATGLKKITEKVFSTSATSQHQHRLVLMVTDGLTQERDGQNYSAIINQYSIKLGVIFIELIEQSTSQLLVNNLKDVSCVTFKSKYIDQLSKHLAQLMNDMLTACLKDSMETSNSTSKYMIKIQMPRIGKELMSNISWKYMGHKKLQQQLNTNIDDFLEFSINNSNTTIPKLNCVKHQLNDYLSQSADHTDYFQAINKLRDYYRSYTGRVRSEHKQKAINWWNDEEHLRSNLIDELTLVLDEVIFPLNKYTRRQAAIRGSSLYMPGLIKAMTSEWTYKKIFSAKRAGAKRDHALCFVLDISTSMFGAMAEGLKETLIAFIGACRRLELDNFSVIVFGTDVRLVKTHEQQWDASVILTLIEQMDFNTDADTRDADAIEVAIDLLVNTSTRGEKKIFLITDGYGHCGKHLPMVQQRAEDARIDLLAIAVGFDRVNLANSYKLYLHCCSSHILPKVLRNVFENEKIISSNNWNTGVSITSKQNKISLNKEYLINQSEPFFDEFAKNKRFAAVIKQMTSERNQLLEQTNISNISFDVCFCLDCTGSMTGWLPRIKSQLMNIIRDIKNKISEEFRTLKVHFRFAIVGYRDATDESQFEIQSFTENVEEVSAFLNHLIATGGKDLPEDVLGALDQCLNLTDWNKQANGRIIILITDAPGHGHELHDDDINDAYPNGFGSQTMTMICDRLLMKDAEINLMFCTLNPQATLKMQRAFEFHFRQIMT